MKGIHQSISFAIAMLVVTCASAQMSSNAPNLSVFDLRLGEPLRLPVCDYAPKKLCAEPPYAVRSGSRQRAVVFPLDQCPIEAVAECRLITIELNGKLAAVSFYTRGVETQERVLALLGEKYGPPSYRKITPVQTFGGAMFNAIYASWDFRDLVVTFFGASLHRINSGEVRIELREAAKLREQEQRAREKAVPKL